MHMAQTKVFKYRQAAARDNVLSRTLTDTTASGAEVR